MEGAQAYSIEQGSAEGLDWTRVGELITGSAPFAKEVEAAPGLYQYRVRACSDANCSTGSSSGISASVSMKVYDFNNVRLDVTCGFVRKRS